MGWSIVRPTGLTHHIESRSTKGYTLFTEFGNDAFLIDMAGRIVHKWSFDTIDPGYGRLLDNGNLLMSGSEKDLGPPPEDEPTKPPPPFERHVMRLGGYKNVLHEVDWDGNVVWEYRNRFQHHDFIRLPNGNTMVPEWVELSDELHRKVKGGYKVHRERLPRLLSDDLVEGDPDGQEVRRINVWKLLDPVKDPIVAIKRRWEWTHVNAIDINEAGDIAFSARSCDRIGVIDGATGALTFKFTETQGQHHVTWVDDRKILVFDNGYANSRVLEIDVDTSEITWKYQGNPGPQFYSGHISGVERLWSGSVLVCEGTSGRLFEVTRDHEIVWEWINPITTTNESGRASNSIYRAHRYRHDHPALAGHDLDPMNHAAENRLLGLM